MQALSKPPILYGLWLISDQEGIQKSATARRSA